MQFVPTGHLTLVDAVARVTRALAPREARAFAECAKELRSLEATEGFATVVRGMMTVPGSKPSPSFRMTEEQVARLASLRAVRDRYHRAHTTAATQLRHALYDCRLQSFRHGRTETMQEIPAGRWGTPAGGEALLSGGVPEADGRTSHAVGECVLVREDALAAWLGALSSTPAMADREEETERPSPSQAYQEVVAHLRGLAAASPDNPTHTADQLWEEIKRSPRWSGLILHDAYEGARREAFADYPNWTRRGIRRRARK